MKSPKEKKKTELRLKLKMGKSETVSLRNGRVMFEASVPASSLSLFRTFSALSHRKVK